MEISGKTEHDCGRQQDIANRNSNESDLNSQELFYMQT